MQGLPGEDTGKMAQHGQKCLDLKYDHMRDLQEEDTRKMTQHGQKFLGLELSATPVRG